MSGIPYQAYKSKRHSRTVSAASVNLLQSSSLAQDERTTPAATGPTAMAVACTNNGAGSGFLEAADEPEREQLSQMGTQKNTDTTDVEDLTSPKLMQLPLPADGPPQTASSSTNALKGSTDNLGNSSPRKKTSTFKRIPLRQSIGSSPLRHDTGTLSSGIDSTINTLVSEANTTPKGKHASIGQHALPPRIVVSGDDLVLPSKRTSSLISAQVLPQSSLPQLQPNQMAASDRSNPLPPTPSTSPPPLRTPNSASRPSTPAYQPVILSASKASIPPVIIPAQRISASTSAPYRPGFQPKGVYTIHTDQFMSRRKQSRASGRVEREKLERRLAKLIKLHFPNPDAPAMPLVQEIPSKKRPTSSRSSSFFEIDVEKLRNMDAGEILKGVLKSQVTPGSKADIRDAEQRITPWQEDAYFTKCPICTVAFHPLTNRKHHCRLCGQIICALPSKRPIRPAPCSILFIVDAQRRIEEVGEGVHYGVSRKARSGSEDKFLKGVRICKECRPTLLRQQYYQDIMVAPLFAQMYEVLYQLEKEIEDDLPQFQELLLNLSHDDAPTKGASNLRKRLLESFARYDAIAKRIRKLPSGQGTSQDRVQQAIASRANLFLQKNMFPLQALPKAKSRAVNSDGANAGTSQFPIDVAPDLAHALQPLLEQEALLEGFVMEAKAHRKFEDAKTLKDNLDEIRAEISRLVSASNTQQEL